MTCRFRVGKHGRTFTDYQEAWLEARQRARTLWLLLGSRAVLELPAEFTITQRIGHIVYVNHATIRGAWRDGAGDRRPQGHLSEDAPWINVNHATGELRMSRPLKAAPARADQVSR